MRLASVVGHGFMLRGFTTKGTWLRRASPWLMTLLCACGSASREPGEPGAAPAEPSKESPKPALAAPDKGARAASPAPQTTRVARPGPTPTIGIPSVVHSFEERRKAHEGLDFHGLVNALGAKPAPETKLDFAPNEAQYYEQAKEALQLTAQEDALFRKHGFVEVDHQQPYSMGSLYYGVYTRDLPVLITTDSILYAWHRSFDNALAYLEEEYLAPELQKLLTEAHADLHKTLPSASGNAATALRDADVYLTVALNLLDGAAGDVAVPAADAASAPSGAGPANPPNALGLTIVTASGRDAQVAEILDWVRKRTVQKIAGVKTPLFGQKRFVDYSQFVPRSHYTKSEALKRYFRAMMWLGRADTGILLAPRKSAAELSPQQRELYRGALTLSALLTRQDRGTRLSGMRALVDKFVGSGTALAPEALAKAATKSSLPLPVTDEVLERELPKMVALDGQSLIRSRTLYTSPNMSAPEEPLEALFQTFSQRFTLDSFFLSKLVFDSIRFDKQKVDRRMPEGRDAMAALGNDEAVFELEASLNRGKYAANLLAARQIADAYSEGDWAQSIYNQWLNALRTLDEPPQGTFAPQVMKSRLWQTRQLEAQLSSWANLRHDTILYTQQSYTAAFFCEYPTGYVEPYPELFRRVADMAGPLSSLLTETRESVRDANAQNVLVWLASFFARFEKTALTLEKLAQKELAGTSFTDDERFFLKQTIDIRGGGSGGPSYTGWYAKLIYGENPNEFNPTVSDVHSDTMHGQVLQVGVGAAKYLMVAIDNGSDRMVYVGPKYSYYEFTHPISNRLTDEQWELMLLSKTAPARPAWSQGYRSKPLTRELLTQPVIPKNATPEERSRLLREHEQKRRAKAAQEMRASDKAIEAFGELPSGQ